MIDVREDHATSLIPLLPTAPSRPTKTGIKQKRRIKLSVYWRKKADERGEGGEEEEEGGDRERGRDRETDGQRVCDSQSEWFFEK